MLLGEISAFHGDYHENLRFGDTEPCNMVDIDLRGTYWPTFRSR
jgi:hypothetical protein